MFFYIYVSHVVYTELKVLQYLRYYYVLTHIVHFVLFTGHVHAKNETVSCHAGKS